jgi:hypothetical protein
MHELRLRLSRPPLQDLYNPTQNVYIDRPRHWSYKHLSMSDSAYHFEHPHTRAERLEIAYTETLVMELEGVSTPE